MTDLPSPPAPAAAAPVAAPAAAVIPSEPFTRGELRACLAQPHRTLDVVLAERGRLAASVVAGRELIALVALLLVCSTLFAVPFAAVDGTARAGHVAVLFLGSVLLCFPSLVVFAAYLGVRLAFAQHLTIALLIPAAAALFTFGFFPIHWFLGATMPADSVWNGSAVRVVLLVCALLLALSHCNRCLFADASLKVLRSSWPLWLGWQVLLVFITYRMASTLGLLA
jgi:hypothetical protein